MTSLRGSRSTFILGILVTWALVAGCRDEQIRVYPVAKTPLPSAATTASGGGASATPASATAPEVPHWTLPEGWQEQPGSGMRFATLLATGVDPPVEVRVTPLSRAARDPLANVNRWRQQIGLGPIAPDALDTVSHLVDLGDRKARVVDMTGAAPDGQEPPAVLAAMVEGQQVWFFVVMDRAPRVAAIRDGFEQLVASLHLEAAAPPPGHPPIGAADTPPIGPPASGGRADGGGGETLTWENPKGWESVPGDAMRVASFHVHGDGGAEAQVAITRFPGDVGGLLANVNRWRRQVGLPPVGSVDEQPMETLEVEGSQARYLDLTGQGATPQRMLVLLISRPAETWFVKMTGPPDLVETQREVFRTFCRSLHFEEGSPRG